VFTPTAQAQNAGATGGIGLTGDSFVAIRVADVEAAARWYHQALGLEEVKRIEGDDRAYSIRILSGNVLSVELIQQRDVTDPTDPHLGLFKVGFYVADVEAYHERLAGLGVDVDPQVFVDDVLGVRSFVFRDPEGNRLQAFQTCGASC
jgi:catechol 2,3-dioxygenase-like lactoylglutathione lyase family enzyme